VKSRIWTIVGAGLFVTGFIIAAVQVALAFRQIDLPGGPDPHRVSVSIGLPISIALAGIIVVIIGAVRSRKH
jgi:hypothetical protein